MWVSQITGALSGLYSCIDVVHNNDMSLRRGGANVAYRVPETVANKYLVGIWLFLIDSLSNLLNGKGLLTIR
ncbi:MAG: hypothetical protein Fur0044_37930 [Anaerolineae bacterium]